MAVTSTCHLCEIYKSQRDALETHVARTAQRSDELGDQVKRLENDIQIMSEEKTSQTQRSYDQAQRVELLENEVQAMSEEKTSQAQRLTTETERSAKLVVEVQALKQQVNTLTEDGSLHAQEHVNLEERATKMNEDMTNLTSDHQQFRVEKITEVRKLLDQVRQLEKKCAAKDDELQRLQRQPSSRTTAFLARNQPSNPDTPRTYRSRLPASFNATTLNASTDRESVDTSSASLRSGGKRPRSPSPSLAPQDRPEKVQKPTAASGSLYNCTTFESSPKRKTLAERGYGRC